MNFPTFYDWLLVIALLAWASLWAFILAAAAGIAIGIMKLCRWLKARYLDWRTDRLMRRGMRSAEERGWLPEDLQ